MVAQDSKNEIYLGLNPSTRGKIQLVKIREVHLFNTTTYCVGMHLYSGPNTLEQVFWSMVESLVPDWD
ncbi:hypothetical protein Y1Q_0011648 [Alligator mississippiensis]|uniref:Uncharacterized protein n=1 Tax=Alligator mississippiensis TaxID=8496 RepID=A0A151M0P7_ALLMI|nr:hypothetical protein Y1Q_0011648 [Alligator mississippiensis]